MGELADILAGKCDPNDAIQLWEMEDRVGILLTLDDSPGILNKALTILQDNKINMTSIQSRPPKTVSNENIINFNIDFHGSFEDQNVQAAMEQLDQISKGITKVGSKAVPWFPIDINDFDHIGKRVLSEGDGIQDADHPGFRDPVYIARRDEITQMAMDYRMRDPISRVTYTDQEKEVWKYCYNNLIEMFKTNACDEFNWAIAEFQKEINLCANEIPQLDDISNLLRSRTGWRLKPVGGLLTQREFLNGLAFKVFHSTQYIRHHAQPLYTPEPDILHELMGHAPMFAHQEFADFSQEIGLASLGASEVELKRLAAIYWFTIEFGMCKQGGKPKAYGAGILSSVGELAYCVTDEPEFKPLDPYEIAQHHLSFPISSMQPTYFIAESFAKAKQQITDYCDDISKPFAVSYNSSNDTVTVDRKIHARMEGADSEGPLF